MTSLNITPNDLKTLKTILDERSTILEEKESDGDDRYDYGKYLFTGTIKWSIDNILNKLSFESVQVTGGKSAKKTVKKECPVKTSRTHKGKDGVVRRLYKRGVDFFVKVKSSVTGKFVYKKVKAA